MYCCAAFFTNEQSREAAYQRLIWALKLKNPFLGHRPYGLNAGGGLRPCQDTHQKCHFVLFAIHSLESEAFADKSLLQKIVLEMSPAEAWSILTQRGKEALLARAVKAERCFDTAPITA